MPVTQSGIVYYADDPHKRVFRVVYPEFDDSELDQPPTDSNRQIMRKPDGTPHDWTSFGTDGARVKTFQKISNQDTTPRKSGTPLTPATEPVIYWVNIQPIQASLTQAQNDQIANWLAAGTQWSNNFIDLGVGDVATLTATCISPCWIVVVGGGTPAIGTLTRSVTVRNVNFALWVT